MRISDWSSDVCSSDIDAAGEIAAFGDEVRERLRDTRMFSLAQDAHGSLWVGAPGRLLRVSFDGAIDEWNRRRGDNQVPSGYIDILRIAPDEIGRAHV